MKKTLESPASRATLIGVIAILLWSSLAILTVKAGGIPPFQLLALTFAVAFILGMVVLSLARPSRLHELRQPFAPWISAFAAIFLYHALYFFALSWAPPAQASLIAYLWPLLIVVTTAARHLDQPRIWVPCLVGAFLGFIGTAMIITGDGYAVISANYILGYLAALACAVVWSSYSVFNTRFRDAPSGMLIGVCGAVAVAGLAFHAALEPWVTPSLDQWAAIVALGAGPTGLAFLAWDHATKRGHIAYLGLLSYLAPLVSTVLLLLAGRTTFTPQLAISAALIITGAFVPRLFEVLQSRFRRRHTE